MSNFARVKNKKKRVKPIRGLSMKQKKAVSQIIEKKFETKLERKHSDTELLSLPIDTVPDFTILSDIPTGTDSNGRIGDVIDVESIQYKLAFTIGDSTNYLRFVLFQWFSDSVQDAPQWNQIFQLFTGTLPTNLTEFMSPLLLSGPTGSSRNQFKIIAQQDFILDVDNPVQLISGFINKNYRKKLLYNEGLTSGSNQIYMMTISDSGAIAHPSLDGWVRIRYTDA